MFETQVSARVISVELYWVGVAVVAADDGAEDLNDQVCRHYRQ